MYRYLVFIFLLVIVGCNPLSEGQQLTDSDFNPAIDSQPPSNPSSSSSTTSNPISIITSGGAYLYDDLSVEKSCLAYLNSSLYGSEGDGLYIIDPLENGSQIQVYCDMTTDGGGWTLITNRQGDVGNLSVETCGSDLNAFFQATCGTSDSISKADSYNIGDGATRLALLSANEWMFKYFDTSGVEDTDDGYIIHHNSDLFFSSTGVLNKILVTQICDFANANCDSTSVYFMWVGDGWWNSATCNTIYTTGAYLGNYSYCHNDTITAYSSGSLFGDRSNYSESKLWGYNGTARLYQERIFIR